VDNGLSDYNPDLQKLRDFRSVLRSDDKYFHTVGWVYRNSGFRALGDALEFSGAIVHRLAEPTSRVVPRKQALKAIRRIQVALRDTPRYMPKFSKGHPYEATTSSPYPSFSIYSNVTYPNYTGLAFRYLSNLQEALYNQAKGHRLTKHIPAPKKELWIRVNSIEKSYLVNGALFQNGTMYTASGAYTYSASFSVETSATFNGSGSLKITAVGPMVLTLSGSNLQKSGTSGQFWVAFPPEVLVPGALINENVITLGVPYTVNGVALPAGTKIFQVDDDFSVPEGAISLDGTDLSAAPTPAS
jgi:hypothetical protein